MICGDKEHLRKREMQEISLKQRDFVVELR